MCVCVCVCVFVCVCVCARVCVCVREREREEGVGCRKGLGCRVYTTLPDVLDVTLEMGLGRAQALRSCFVSAG